MNAGRADRNLLFGILAVQLDFVSRDALIDAINVWVLTKDRPLGDIFVDQGVLSTDDCAALETIVEKHLQKHGGDLQRSFAVQNAPASLHESLRHIADADLQASVAGLSTVEDSARTGPFVAAESPAVGTVTSAGLRFQIVRPHARGGLGEVFVAHDGELNRQVALKEIQDKYANDPQSRARFLLEAEITGGLEHPAIVPVYGLGHHPDGRPFYAMRFIEGESLKDAIARFHAAEGPRRDPGQRVLELRKLLDRFLDVCQAIAYAHSRGVLHRDLKPANVMLGPYGETLVVDWGLAKAGVRYQESGISEPARNASDGRAKPPLQPASAEELAATQPGSVVGTVAYMSPEQAARRLDLLGPASDIYGLGATLYCLLTGRPPFGGQDRGEVLRKVQCGDFPAPRVIASAVPRPLEAICLKAMAVKPEDRYPSAKALAEDAEHWLADEPVSAHREPLPARGRRWARRHKPLVAGVVALLLTTLVLGGSGFAWWVWRQARLQRAVTEDLRQGEEVLRDDGDLAEVRQALERAEGRLAGGGPARLRSWAQRLRDEVALVARLEEARLQDSVAIGFDVSAMDRKYAAEFADYDLDLSLLSAEEAAERIRRSPIRTQLVMALDHWALVKDSLIGEGAESVRAVARQADDDPWRRRLRELAPRGDPGVLESLANEETAATQSPTNVAQLGRALRFAGRQAAAERLLRPAVLRHPNSFEINYELASAVNGRKPPDTGGAIGFYRAALALRPRSALLFLYLGHALKDQGKLSEAESNLRQAIRHKPDYIQAYNSLGNILADQGKLAEAVEMYGQAIDREPGYSMAYCSLGGALRELGKLPEAEDACRKAIALKPDFAGAHSNLGAALISQGKLPQGEDACRKAIALGPDFAEPYNNLGAALSAQGKPAEAEAAYRTAIALRPNDPETQCNLGNTLSAQRKPAEAEAAFRQAIAVKPDFAAAHLNLGAALANQGKLVQAEAAYRRAIALKPDYALGHCGLGFALRGQGRFAEALAAFKKGHELGSRRPDWRYPSAQAIREMDQLGRLDARLPKLLEGEEKPAGVKDQMALASFCQMHKKLYAAATQFYSEAFTAEPKLAENFQQSHRYNGACAAALAGCGRGEDAAKLKFEVHVRLRQQALIWLRADLIAWNQLLEKQADQVHPTVLKAMHHWQRDADFAGIRGEALVKLPEAERKEWRKLWEDVEALRKRAAEGSGDGSLPP